MPQEVRVRRPTPSSDLPLQVDMSEVPLQVRLPEGEVPEAPAPEVRVRRSAAEPWIIRTGKKILPTAARVGGAVIGGIAGSVLGGPGPGTIAGGAFGSGAGDLLAQEIEKASGTRTETNPGQVLMQTAIGAVPVVGRATTVGRTIVNRAAQGAALGGAAEVGTRLAEGERINLPDLGTATLLGAGMGALGGKMEVRVRKPRVVSSVSPDDAARLADRMRSGETKVRINGVLQDPIPGVAPDLPPRFPVIEGPDGMPMKTTGGMEGGTYTGPDQPTSTVAPHERPVLGGPVDMPMSPSAPAKKSPAAIEAQARAQGADIPPARPIQDHDKVVDEMVNKFPEHQREEMRDVLTANEGFTAQRREVQPIARQEALAQYLTVERTRMAPGTILNAEQSIALEQALAHTQDAITPLAARVAAKEATPKDVLQLEKLRQDYVVLVSNYLGNRAEQGRALGNRRFLREALASKDDLLLTEALRRVKPTDVDAFAQAWTAAPDDLARLKLVRDSQTLSKWDVIESSAYSGMLSGVRTHLRNLFGTGVNGAFHTLAHPLAVAWDIGLSSSIPGRARTLYLGELSPRVAGAVAGIRPGLTAALQTLRDGVGPRAVDAFDVPRKELKGAIERYGVGPVSVKVPEAMKPVNRAVAKAMNMPGRLLDAEDQAMFEVFYGSEFAGRLYARARSEGFKRGLRGADLDAHITEAMAEGQLHPPADLAQDAERAAKEILYREDPGAWLQGFMALKQKPGWKQALHFLVPFTRIAGNIMRQSVENLPGGFIATRQGRTRMAAGGREAAELAGRETATMIGLSAIAYWASQGKVSGHGPDDPAKRAALLSQGWQPHSIKIGDTWVDYTIAFQPIAGPLFALANLWERMDDQRAKGEPMSPDDVAPIVFSVGKSITDQSFLSGLADFNNALNDPDRYGSNYVGRAVAGRLPFAGLGRNLAQAVDPVIREPKSFGDHLKSVVPGLSATVDPKLTPAGLPAERPAGIPGVPAAIQRGFSPVTLSRVSSDPVVQTLKTLGAVMSAPQRSLDATRTSPKIDLTTEERTRVGQVSNEAVKRLAANPTFQRLMVSDPAQAKAMIENQVGAARRREYDHIRAVRRRTQR